MKLKTSYLQLLSCLFCLSACIQEQIDVPVGHSDEMPGNMEQVESVGIRCVDAPDGEKNLIFTFGQTDDYTLGFQAWASIPLPKETLINVEVDASLVESYSVEKKVDYQLLPAMFYAFPEGNQLIIQEGKSLSAECQLKIQNKSKYGDVLQPGRYLLPLVSSVKSDHPAIFIELLVREKYHGDYVLYLGDEMFFSFYVNTAMYDPRIATDYNLEWTTVDGINTINAIGNIINLRKSVVLPDRNNNPSLALYPDLKYVLENSATYILPIQESGRKVCLCIEGGGKGLGFCNLTEDQIESLTDQIVSTVGQYHLQGVNLWDRGTNYGLEGMPEVNTTSYPLFIKRLREKLGRDKLLTLVDFEEPTAGFWDEAACGGIEVGKYIDYAWSGYNRNDEPVQVIDPWHQDADCVSKVYPRKPIAGMEPQYYGSINAYWRSSKMDLSIYDLMLQWETAGLRQSNIFVFEDLRSNLQDIYEGQAWNVGEFLMTLMNTEDNADFRDFQLIPMDNTTPGSNGYGKWLKDW